MAVELGLVGLVPAVLLMDVYSAAVVSAVAVADAVGDAVARRITL